MSLYIIVAIALLVGVIMEYRQQKTPRVFFIVMFVLLGVMLCLRYGQGSDYFNYRLLYSGMTGSLKGILENKTLHSEHGWKILCWSMQKIGIKYTVFVFFISLIEMWLFSRFLKGFCKNRFLGLFLGYHTLYLTYLFSTLRQGLVVAIFLGAMLELLTKKKYIYYGLLCLLCASFHSIGWLLFAVPIVQIRLLENRKWQLIFVIAAWAVGLIIATKILNPVLELVLPARILNYMRLEQHISLLAVAERLGTYAVVFFVYWYSVYKQDEEAKDMTLLMRIATLGVIIYGGFIWQPLVASRLSYPLKVVEIAILSSLLYKDGIFSRLKMVFCTCLVSVMLLKNINAYLGEGTYKSHINAFNYPYFSVLNSDELPYGRFLPLFDFPEKATERLPLHQSTGSPNPVFEQE